MAMQEAEEIRGFYKWTWTHGDAPAGTNLSAAFSGWTDPDTALAQSEAVYAKLLGQKFITLGGGNENGAWSADSINAVMAAIAAGRFAKYDGIAFDIEEGDSGLQDNFESLFKAAKLQNLATLVTVSHSAPYGISDGAALMASFFDSNSIDTLSPQLYTTGKESKNDYGISHGVKWAQYAGARPAIVPSIVKANLYDQGGVDTNAKLYFSQSGVALAGYIQWL